MVIQPSSLATQSALLEDIEMATLRLVAQAIENFPRSEIISIFARESDLVADIGEDLTREALDRMGTSIIPVRLFGKMDYKRARYLFLPQFAVRQALFIDSKAEKASAVVRLQQGQTSLIIKQVRAGVAIVEQGGLPTTITSVGGDLLTTTVFVKYSYTQSNKENHLQAINIIGLPNGYLQDKYNPTPTDGIWNAGPNAPSRGEKFRARINMAKLKAKARWRVQTLPGDATLSYQWQS